MENQQTSQQNTVIAFIVILIAIIVGGIFVYLSRPQPTQIIINPPQPTATPAPTNTPQPVTVYVIGEVNSPQITLVLPAGSRVQDAIERAGGFTEDANLDAINLAGIVRDGDQINVPSLNSDDPLVLPTQSGGGIIFINSATLEELMTLPGIGEVTAQAILDYRTENGSFTSLEDLDNVSGIGASTLQNIAPLISFE